MEPRIKNVIEELTELNPIRKGKIIMDIKLDDSSKVFGLSLKVDTGVKSKEELVWMEVTDNKELMVKINPEIDNKAEYSQDFWTVLYCISANLKREEGDVWGDLDISEIAEELFESRCSKLTTTSELEAILEEEGALRLEEGAEEELEDLELNISLDTLTSIIMEYDDVEAVTVVNFINRLTDISGIDLDIELSIEDDTKGVDSKGIKKREDARERDKHGILDQEHVIRNVSYLINHFLTEEAEGEDTKETIIFLNQLIFERLQIEQIVSAIFPEEEEDE